MLKLIITFLLVINLTCLAQYEIPLYMDKVPNSIKTQLKEEKVFNTEVDSLISKVTNPSLRVFCPAIEKSNGTAVIICPGGGYHTLLIKREGNDIAKAFNKIGVTAFVLKYRLPNSEIMINKSIGPLQDAQKAIQVVRERAVEWSIDPNKIGIMGFSAGGHLAATAGTHFENAVIDNKRGTSLRPDFMILIYPVISFTDSIGHIGSKENLIGRSPSKELIHYFSNEKHICSATPPAFITQSYDDIVVPLSNSIVFFEALRKFSVPAELHIYSKGGHGYLKQPPFEEWFERCQYWMKSSGWL